ncbi:MAG TPA: tetratricopeptide repeat protein [Acidobacteriaceae bacterium]|nr:tetratricopeptide repeat protein [Acidobacteriaceae bacterium]
MALLTLLGITLALSVITYFFFNSFSAHRRVLEARWYTRGQQALANGNATYAVEAFRSALTLSSGNRTYELALAQALASAGHTDEAIAYYSTLQQAEPGDGLLNLQLARLAVKKKEPAQAIAYYRASLNGDWLTEGVSHRREARLELAQYLLSLRQFVPAQEELLTAQGNSLEDPSVMNQIAALLQQAQDPSDALTAYQKAQQYAQSNSVAMLQALLGESQVAESLGRYQTAHDAMERYMERVHRVSKPPLPPDAAQASLNRLQRLLDLTPLSNLPPRERARRLLVDGSAAHHRFSACNAQLQSSTPPTDNASLVPLQPQWQSFSNMSLKDLADNQKMQDSLWALINQTETLTSSLCGAPSGDDALLLQLATVPYKTE